MWAASRRAISHDMQPFTVHFASNWFHTTTRLDHPSGFTLSFAALFPRCTAGETSDFYMLQAEEPETITQTVVDLVKTRLPRKFGVDSVRDIQVLCPMNRGITGGRGINQSLQAALNPPGEHSVEKFGYAFSIGDQVMQIENNYDREVYNGGIGYVAEIDREEDELVAEFAGRLVRYPFGELDELVLCYATTIHKSQGSEYPVVVIPVSTQHYNMLKRNLIYTGIAHLKRLVVLVAQKRTLSCWP
jgi:exodeoxyribonuclease V alpha subunit